MVDPNQEIRTYSFKFDDQNPLLVFNLNETMTNMDLDSFSTRIVFFF
jgi:hypothetical protein